VLLALSSWGASRPIAARAPITSTLAREEFFVLELARSANTQPARAPAVVGVSVWRRSEGSDVQLECETRFFEERTRVQQIERPSDDAARFVWREWRANKGRTVRVQWNAASERFDLVEWGRSEPIRVELDAAGELHWPLEAIELARDSSEMPSPFVWFDALSRSCERVHASVEWRGQASATDANAQELLRRVRLEDDSGVCVGEFDFVADELRSYRWQAGGLRARRVESDEYERLIREHETSLVVR